MRILNFYQLKIEIVSSGSKSGFQSESQFAASPENVAFGFWHHFYYGQILIPLVKVVFEFAVVVTQEFIALS